MNGQRAEAALILKSGETVAERYSDGSTAGMRVLTHAMAKTVLALGVLKTREKGLIRLLDDTAATFEETLDGTLFGDTKIINLFRTASGARFVKDRSDIDDRVRYGDVLRDHGVVAAERSVMDRAEPDELGREPSRFWPAHLERYRVESTRRCSRYLRPVDRRRSGAEAGDNAHRGRH